MNIINNDAKNVNNIYNNEEKHSNQSSSSSESKQMLMPKYNETKTRLGLK